MLLLETIVSVVCVGCEGVIPREFVQKRRTPAGSRELTAYCPHCDRVYDTGYYQGEPASAGDVSVITGEHRREFLASIGQLKGDVQAHKPNTAATKKTLSMARPTYNQVGGCVLT